MGDLKDMASNDPGWLFASIVVWIPVSIWVVSLIHWMIQGDIDVLSGFAGSVIGLVLGMLTVKPPFPNSSFLFLGAILAVMFMYPFIKNTVDARAHQAIDVDIIRRAYEGIDENPNNFGARWRLAQQLYHRGVYGHALQIADDLLAKADQEIFHDEIKLLNKWKDQIRPDEIRPLPCLECGWMNEPGEVYCHRCNSKFLLDYAKGKWLGYRSMRRLISVWIAAVSGLVGIPTALASLPPRQAIVVIPLLMIVSILIIWRAFAQQNEADTA